MAPLSLPSSALRNISPVNYSTKGSLSLDAPRRPLKLFFDVARSSGSLSYNPLRYSLIDFGFSRILHQVSFFFPRKIIEFATFICCRFSVDYKGMVMKTEKRKRGLGAICFAAPLARHTLQWISTVSST